MRDFSPDVRLWRAGPFAHLYRRIWQIYLMGNRARRWRSTSTWRNSISRILPSAQLCDPFKITILLQKRRYVYLFLDRIRKLRQLRYIVFYRPGFSPPTYIDISAESPVLGYLPPLWIFATLRMVAINFRRVENQKTTPHWYFYRNLIPNGMRIFREKRVIATLWSTARMIPTRKSMTLSNTHLPEQYPSSPKCWFWINLLSYFLDL